MNRCLVVNDSRIMRKVARAILEDLSFEAAEADNSEAALHYCRADMPELILLDFDLPRTGGLEFLRKLKHLANGKCPTIVFSTTEHDIDLISHALAAGANDFVQKPFDRETLKSKLSAVGLI